MDELISRQAAIEVLEWFEETDPLGHTPAQIVRALPAAEPRKGKWIPNNVVNAVCPWCCSECNSNQMDRTPYCQMCGARMEEEHAGE